MSCVSQTVPETERVGARVTLYCPKFDLNVRTGLGLKKYIALTQGGNQCGK